MNHLLQSTAFAALAAMAAIALRRYRAGIRYSVWFAASMKFLVPFSLLFDIGARVAWHTPVAAPQAVSRTIRQFREPLAPLGSLTVSFDPASADISGSLKGVIAIAWAAGFLLIVTSWSVRWLRIRRCVRRASPLMLPDGTVALTSHEFSEPGVYGICRPVLMLPARIALEAPEEQLRAIVAHERWHIQRRDNLTAALHMAVEALFWFHPLVWWIGSRLLEERERACDEEVLRHSAPETYAAGILTVCELCLEPPLPCVSSVTGGKLRKRIEQIMSPIVPPDLSRGKKSALVAAAAVILLVCVIAGAQSVSFDAVSIKAVPPTLGGFPGQPGYFLRPRVEDPKRFRSIMRTQSLIEWAYRLPEYRILGAPDWVRDARGRYAVEATAAQPVTRAEMERMVQTLLADRFNLKFHRETREMPVFLLTTAKNGPKMEASSAPELNFGDGTIDIGRGDLIAHSIQMETLAGILTENLERPVLNRTGLTGKYDFTVHYDPGLLVDWRLGPALPSMLGDIGLRIDSSRQPVELMVIDSIDRPTEN